MNEMSILEQKVLKELQKGIEPVTHPYRTIAEKLNCTENDIIKILDDLMQRGLVRKYGAIIAPKKLGYVSTLAAMEVPEAKIEEVGQMVNSFHGVTHNYLRDGEPNLWFTMIEKNDAALDNNLSQINDRTGLEVIKLPARKTYKIGVKFDI